MDVLRIILLVLHFVGIGSLLGGFLVQMKALGAGKAIVNPAMLHGALTMLVSGLLLVGVAELGGHDVNFAKIGLKTGILVVIFVLILLYWRKDRVPSWAIGLIGALTVANIAIAVAWH